ncbi:MAG: MFS transporter, partial [Clostridia bacterium]|nr:MFS transporter [Clostridia bacterium]
MEKEELQKKDTSARRSVWLIVLCWLVYTCSYIGKLGYNANVTQIETAFNVTHADAGMVSTFFFFAYGGGQIVNGLFCKKYNIRYVILGGLLVSGFCNLSAGIVSNFTILKYLWLLNGASLSLLWTSLVRVLSETLDEKYLGKAIFAMGTTVATGTFLVYGMSALFVAVSTFRITFYVAGLLLPAIALVWLFAYPALTKKSVEEGAQDECLTMEKTQAKNDKGIKAMGFSFAVFALFAVVDNLVKDGLTTWTPMVMKELYSLPDYASILLTLCLPILAVFGTSLAVNLHKKIKDFVWMNTLLFIVSSALIGLVILFLPKDVFVVTLVCFALISCLMASVNNVVTSM